MKKNLLFIGMISWACLGISQSMPSVFNLSSGTYNFTSWDSLSPAGTYPPNMVFNISTVADPGELDEPSADWLCLYNITSRSRVNGLGTDGLSFLNTSNFQDTDVRCGGAAGDVGGYIAGTVVGLNTSSRQNIGVSYKASLLSQGDGIPAPRVYNLQLQYKIGAGTWTNVSSGLFSSNGLTTGDDQIFSNLSLPAECNNQSAVYLRWKYFMLSANDGGTRPKIGLDDITVSSDVFTGIESINGAAKIRVAGQNETTLFLSQPVSIQVYDSLGKLHFKQDQTSQVNISLLEKGCYILRSDAGLVHKFIK